MTFWNKKPMISARALIIRDGKLLVMHRKRFSSTGDGWIEYHSIPGGEIDQGEQPEEAVVRELFEEMGVEIRIVAEVAHLTSLRFEHFVFSAKLVGDIEPKLMPDSEEAMDWANEFNQFTPMWVPVSELTRENLRYYSDYLELIQALARGEKPTEILRIDVK